MESMIERLKILKDRGYTVNFCVSRQGQLLSKDKEVLSNDEVNLDGIYRIEDQSDPDNQAVVYAVSSNSGEYGVLIDSYGTESDPAIDKFVKQHLRSRKQSISLGQ